MKNRIDLSALKKSDFNVKGKSKTSSVEGVDDAILLSDFIAAMRREFESVALIANSKDSDIPQFSISEVKSNFSYKVTSVSSDGVKIKVLYNQLKDNPENNTQHLEINFSDIDVHSALAGD
ncbi:MAG: hypothetical protein Q9M92_09330 [Enterobacterales bacterium]|nr:hypothetical protein [Enterobacterales bacterium]